MSHESIKITEEIIAPHVKTQRKLLKFSGDHTSLLIMDVFRSQMTTEVKGLLNEENIFLAQVPNNITHLFQLLDLTVNSWYTLKIAEGLEKGINIDDRG